MSREFDPRAAFLAAVIESSDDAILTKSLEGVITTWNPGAERLYGYSAKEAIGRHVSLHVPQYRRGEETRILEIIVGGGRVDHYETERLRKDGVIIPVALTVSPIHDSEGTIIGASAIARDITDRKRAELFDFAPDALVIVDDKGVIRQLNRQAQRLFGYTAEELVGNPVELLIPEDRHERHRALRADFMRNPELRPIGIGLDLSACRKDGSTFPVEISLSPVLTGSGVFVSASVRDITERVAAQKAIAQSQLSVVRSERLAALGRMAAVVGHELRNPLASVVNSLYLVRHYLGDKMTPDAERFLDMAERQANRAAQLAGDVTLYMREREPSIDRRCFGEFVDHVFEASPAPPHIDVTVTGRDTPVTADPTQLLQVVTNLVTNAMQAMPDGGELRIDASLADRSSVICVDDSGKGLEPEVELNLFEPFFTTKGEGTGLGLAIVQRIVQAHGGSVTLTNRIEGGVRACVTLPLRDDAEDPRPGGSTRQP
ncbi:MAG: PAS domain S-box protein [Acidimicrobiales bacterium]